MANFNKVILAGNLTRDPQLTFLPNGTPVAEFGMAINRKWRPQDGGEMREEVCFVDLSCFGKQAETLNKYVSKGKPLMVEGRLKFHQWEAKDGSKRSRLSVVVDNFQFLGGPGGERTGGEYNENRPPARNDRSPRPASASAPSGFDDERPPIDGDDVPF